MWESTVQKEKVDFVQFFLLETSPKTDVIASTTTSTAQKHRKKSSTPTIIKSLV